MKKNWIILIFIIFAAYACKESTTEPTPNEASADYFPNSDANYYFFNISARDSSGLVQSGTRKIYYKGDTTLLQTPYQIKIDTFQLSNIQTVTQSYFRKSSTGVFYYAQFDTSGFSALIPDSLQGAISFDSEYRLLYQPLELNQLWPVYKISANYLSFSFDILAVDAKVISKNTVDFAFNNSTITKEVFTILYTIKLITDLNQQPITFSANGEIAEGIGFVKWEGDSEVINFLAGINIYLPGKYVIEELYGYKSQ
jgi:hypothetical protein